MLEDRSTAGRVSGSAGSRVIRFTIIVIIIPTTTAKKNVQYHRRRRQPKKKLSTVNARELRLWGKGTRAHTYTQRHGRRRRLQQQQQRGGGNVSQPGLHARHPLQQLGRHPRGADRWPVAPNRQRGLGHVQSLSGGGRGVGDSGCVDGLQTVSVGDATLPATGPPTGLLARSGTPGSQSLPHAVAYSIHDGPTGRHICPAHRSGDVGTLAPLGPSLFAGHAVGLPLSRPPTTPDRLSTTTINNNNISKNASTGQQWRRQ